MLRWYCSFLLTIIRQHSRLTDAENPLPRSLSETTVSSWAFIIQYAYFCHPATPRRRTALHRLPLFLEWLRKLIYVSSGTGEPCSCTGGRKAGTTSTFSAGYGLPIGWTTGAGIYSKANISRLHTGCLSEARTRLGGRVGFRGILVWKRKSDWELAVLLPNGTLWNLLREK